MRHRRLKTERETPPHFQFSIFNSQFLRLRLAVVLGGVVILAGVMAGLYLLEERVLADEHFQQPPIIRLVRVPEGLTAEITRSLADLEAVPWSDPALCPRIGAALEANPWVKRVVRVRKHADRTVAIECEYRAPLTMVQIDSVFYLVSGDQVRLPGTYRYDPQMIVVQGVSGAPPSAGERWHAPDLSAAVAVVEALQPEPFAGQITAVLVHNYGGRENNREAHISLATDQPGGRIIWGSAPGQELEENSTAEKIAILRDNFRRFGRVDANRRIIDVSLYPDRFTAPA